MTFSINLMARNPNTAAVITPTTMPIISFVPHTSFVVSPGKIISLSSRTKLPKITGMLIRKENFAMFSGFAPDTVPAKMVEPLREIPGKSATACISPKTNFSIFSGPVPSNIATPDDAVVFSARISGRSNGDYYKVVYIPNKSVCVGSTDVKSAMGNFNTKETSYLITFLSDTKAEITVKNAKFAQNMPSVGDMVFSNLNVAYNEDGFVLTSSSLIPTIAGVPYPSFAISDLRMEVELEDLGDADFTFKCSAFGQVFTVDADDMNCLPLTKK